MNALHGSGSSRIASPFLAIAGLASLLTAAPAGAQTFPPFTSIVRQDAIHNRVLAPKLLPRHIRTFGLRADRRGDTPYSSTYYKITNITFEVAGGATGAAYAVNNDLRIAYTDFGPSYYPISSAWIVNNGGTSGELVIPSSLGVPSFEAVALSENNTQIAGNVGQYGGTQYAAAWHLVGPTGSSLDYFTNPSGYYPTETSINDDGVAVGNDVGAVLFEGSSKPPGKESNLQGLPDKGCAQSAAADTANAINDDGEIVGTACNSAVRFSRSGYAQRLPVARASVQSGAEAINQRGDVAGFAGNYAFLYKDNKTLYLPIPKGDQGSRSMAIAFGINASDEIVGTVVEPNRTAGFVYMNGKSYDLNTLIPPNSGWQIAFALGVNDHGEIVGAGYYNGNEYGISLKPPK